MARPTRPYRILITTWQDFGAGSIQSVQYLAEGLAARGHGVQVACPAKGLLGRRLSANGVDVIDFQFRKGWSLSSARKLRDIVDAGRFDLVDAQESRDRKAAILARALGHGFPPLVITRRQMTHSSRLQNVIYSRAADRVVAISHGVAHDLRARGMAGASIRVVHTGLDPRRLERTPSAAEVDALRAELGLDVDRPTLGVVARRKDQETLLRAVTRMGRPVNVLFVGIDRDRPLEALEKKLPPETRVAYTGFREDVRPCWALLDVKVLTTVEEGLSQAILEAMWLGVPVLSAEVGGTPEVVQHGVNGFLFPPSDDHALAELLNVVLDDPRLRERLSAAGRRTVLGHFLAEGLVERTEAVYAELLEGPTASAPQ
ncbi:MAG: glycosyltransferase family 4 protein [Gemmatimonadota bacterium]